MVLFHGDSSLSGVLRFKQALIDKELEYDLMDLLGYGMDPVADLEPAIKRAIDACIYARLPLHEHFQVVFVDHQGQLFKGWRLSKTALRLVLLNANTDNPLISHIQMEMIRRN